MITTGTTNLVFNVSAFEGRKPDVEVKTNLRQLQGPKPAGHGVFRIINQKDGDKRVVWNSGSLDEIADAKQMFNDLVAQGLLPYLVDAKGKKTPSIMEEFDPHAEEIIFVPVKQMVGG